MKLGRHKGIEVKCEQCGNSFIALVQRVEAGLGKYCSKTCFDVWQRENRKSSKHGKENAKTYPKGDGSFFVQWYNEAGKPVNSPWHKWAWEMTYGEIPEGHAIEYVDGNKANTVLENLQLRITKQGRKLFPKPPRKKLSLEDRNKISKNNIINWKKGVFDLVHRGSNNKNFKVKKGRHPKEFNEDLKKFIRERDNHTCQICGEDLLGKKEPVHHIDGVKTNNHPDNLILVCDSCHATIHFSKNSTDPIIMAFRSKLLE